MEIGEKLKQPTYRVALFNNNSAQAMEEMSLNDVELGKIMRYLIECTKHNEPVPPTHDMFNNDRLLYLIAKGMYDNMYNVSCCKKEHAKSQRKYEGKIKNEQTEAQIEITTSKDNKTVNPNNGFNDF